MAPIVYCLPYLFFVVVVVVVVVSREKKKRTKLTENKTKQK